MMVITKYNKLHEDNRRPFARQTWITLNWMNVIKLILSYSLWLFFKSVHLYIIRRYHVRASREEKNTAFIQINDSQIYVEGVVLVIVTAKSILI